MKHGTPVLDYFLLLVQPTVQLFAQISRQVRWHSPAQLPLQDPWQLAANAVFENSAMVSPNRPRVGINTLAV
jgi:hypothetical protein